MRIGIDVGGTNTDAVLMDGPAVLAWTKQPTTADFASGVAAAIAAVLAQSGVPVRAVAAVMIGTTQFTNALVERSRLGEVGVIRLAAPSGNALPPMTRWPAALTRRIGDHLFLLPGGYEVDGREIAPLDEAAVRNAACLMRGRGLEAVAISSPFSLMNPAMEDRAAAIVAEELPAAHLSRSASFGRIGLVERENAAILNASLAGLAAIVTSAFAQAVAAAGITAPTYISQNDGTLISLAEAAALPALTMGSGPTNSMRGAAFLTGSRDAIVMDVGGTTTDIGVLANGYPRQSAVAVDIGGVRTGFRMPDLLAIGLGGGTRIRLDYAGAAPRIGPDSVGFRITEEALVFGGATLTASDVAVALGHARMGDPARLPDMAASPPIWATCQALIEDGLDRMKTARGPVDVLAVGGGHFLIDDALKGAARVIRPAHAAVANAIGAAIAQVGAQVERIVDYDREPREQVLDRFGNEVRGRLAAAGGDPASAEVVDIEEVYLSYLPGRSAQLRLRAVADLAPVPARTETEAARALA